MKENFDRNEGKETKEGVNLDKLTGSLAKEKMVLLFTIDKANQKLLDDHDYGPLCRMAEKSIPKEDVNRMLNLHGVDLTKQRDDENREFDRQLDRKFVDKMKKKMELGKQAEDLLVTGVFESGQERDEYVKKTILQDFVRESGWEKVGVEMELGRLEKKASMSPQEKSNKAQLEGNLNYLTRTIQEFSKGAEEMAAPTEKELRERWMDMYLKNKSLIDFLHRPGGVKIEQKDVKEYFISPTNFYAGHVGDMVDLQESGAISMEKNSGSEIRNLHEKLNQPNNKLAVQIDNLRDAYRYGVIKDRSEYLKLMRENFSRYQAE